MLASLLLASCTPAAKPEPESLSCGTENLRHGDGYDAAIRDCFWQAHQEGLAARLTSIILTVEGDPITWQLERDSRGIRATIDTTKDKFGSPRIYTVTCTQIEQRQGYDNRLHFHLSGCNDRELKEIDL
jgi:hypothetical protein